MKKKKIQIRKYAITFWLAAALIVTGTIAVKAAYTSTKSVKRVISIRDSETLFSSNYLSVSGGIKTRMFHINENETGYVSVPVNVCNYAQGDKTEYNSQDITYDISFKLVDVNGKQLSEDVFGADNPLSSYKVTLEDKTEMAFTAPDTEITIQAEELSSLYADLHKYILSYDVSQIRNPKVYYYVEARPSEGILYVQPLSGIIGVAYQSSTSTGGWTGMFTDDDKKPSSEFDAFNYEISGNGKGNVTLKWNTDIICINPFFMCDDPGSTDAIRNTLTFDVDSAVSGRYLIQFYRANSISDDEDWDYIKSGIISFEYSKSEDEEKSGGQ